MRYEQRPGPRARASPSAISSPTTSPLGTGRTRPPSSPRSFHPMKPTGASPSSNSSTRLKRRSWALSPSARCSRPRDATVTSSARTRIAPPRKGSFWNCCNRMRPTRRFNAGLASPNRIESRRDGRTLFPNDRMPVAPAGLCSIFALYPLFSSASPRLRRDVLETKTKCSSNTNL